MRYVTLDRFKGLLMDSLSPATGGGEKENWIGEGGASEGKIAGIVEDFQQLGVQKVAPCHCSGDMARRLFKEAYREDFISAGVGSKLKIRE